MKESFLHFIWKFKLYHKHALQTTLGEVVEVIATGLPNNGAGPDFLNARVKIGETEWVGNIEIHIRSSDWVQHKHYTDKAYNNVILHVVQHHDIAVTQQNGQVPPTLILQYDPQMEERYQQLLTSLIHIPCQPGIKNIEPFYIRHFLSRLSIERLERKSAEIVDALGNSKNNWREAFYQMLFRSFGFGANSLPFQLLAQATPLRVVEKYCTNVFQSEALLFGQAGFLDGEPLDDYQSKLKAEYTFLKSTYNLTPIDNSLWKFGRLRPANYPTIRIAQMAQLVSKFADLLNSVLEYKAGNDYLTIISGGVSKYWQTHYDFDKESVKQKRLLGDKSIERLITNAVVPFMFTYGKAKNNDDLQDNALKLLDKLPAESNSVIDTWTEIGIKPDSAFYSQALLQLKTNYCDKKRCLQCAIGKAIIEQR